MTKALLVVIALTSMAGDRSPPPAVPVPCMTATAAQVEPISLGPPVLRLVKLTRDSGWVEGRWGPPVLPAIADSGIYYAATWNLTMFGNDTTVMVDSQGTLVPQLRHGWFTDSVLKRAGTPQVMCNKFGCAPSLTMFRDRTGTAVLFDTLKYSRIGNEMLWLKLSVYQCGYAKPRVPTRFDP